jgi:hypothetical protein
MKKMVVRGHKEIKEEKARRGMQGTGKPTEVFSGCFGGALSV